MNKSIKQEENRDNKFIVVYDWLFVLPPSEAIMLSYLIDAEDICYQVDEEDPQYFECTAEFIRRRCVGWTQSNITTALNNLQNKNLISIKNIRTNVGNPRYIKINRDGIKVLKEQYSLLRGNSQQN